jgi:hypothetical protein
MLSKDIDNLTLAELCDLLATNTTELLALLNNRGSNGSLLHDKRADVEIIQSVIKKKKSENKAISVSSPSIL